MKLLIAVERIKQFFVGFLSLHGRFGLTTAIATWLLKYRNGQGPRNTSSWKPMSGFSQFFLMNRSQVALRLFTVLVLHVQIPRFDRTAAILVCSDEPNWAASGMRKERNCLCAPAAN